MRKWVINTTIIISICACLVGCGNAIPELTDDERAEVCEYAAQALVRHTRSYKEQILSEEAVRAEQERLQKQAELKAQIAAELENKQNSKNDAIDSGNGNGDGAVEVPVYRDISEFLGFDNIKINYAGYEVCDSYPTDSVAGDWQGICVATKGNKLVVFQYDIVNESGADATVDIAGLGAKCTFKINGNVNKTALTTMLGNDFCLYRGQLSAGESTRVVAVIELPEGDASSLKSANMKLKKGSDMMETTLF